VSKREVRTRLLVSRTNCLQFVLLGLDNRLGSHERLVIRPSAVGVHQQ
jgi:hypothetical protein